VQDADLDGFSGVGGHADGGQGGGKDGSNYLTGSLHAGDCSGSAL
jgi:hypothetical protein